MKRIILVAILALGALSMACSSGDKKGVTGAVGSGGGTLSGPFMGALYSGGRVGAKMSGTLKTDGSLEFTVLTSPYPVIQAKAGSDGTFAQDATVQGYAVHIEGKVELQPAASRKFIISGTFAASGSTSGTFVLRSLDWQLLDGVKAHMGTPSYGDPLRIAFATETLGFASWAEQNEPSSSATARSALWRTDDGGVTWNQANVVSGIVAQMRVAGQKLWLATSTGLWSSVDLGQSFVPELRFTSEIGNNDSYGPGAGMLLMDFFDATHGALLNIDSGKVWITPDGGKTWNAGAVSNEPGWPFGDSGSLQMISPTEAIVLFPSRSTLQSALLRTTDSGLSWKQVNANITPVAPTSDFYCNGQVTGVQFSDSSKGWAFNGQCLATTTDGGVTWTWSGASGASVSCGSPGRLLAATSNRVFVACQSGGLMVSSDGGNTFNRVLPTPESVTGVKIFPDGSGLLLAGSTLYATSDSGTTWAAQPSSALGISGLAPVSGTEWWAWTSLGLEHVSLGGAAREIVLAKGNVTELRTTVDAVWAALDLGSWIAFPLAGGTAQAVAAPGLLWPISRTTLLADILDTTNHPGLEYGLALSTDGGQTWKNIVGPTGGSGWSVCPVDATHAWIVGNGAFYMLENGMAQLVFSDPQISSPDQIVFCDASRFWFIHNDAPKILSGGVITEQAVPMEWRSSKPHVLVTSPTTASAISEGAAWLALADGRMLRFMNDAAYAAYQGPAVLGTPPVTSTPAGTSSSGTGGSAGTSTGATGGPSVSSNRPPTLGEISSVAHYNYDVDGNYMGGTIQLFTSAGDPDGDNVTISWALETHSGGPSLASTTGTSNILILDSFASGTVRVTASDGKGGTDTGSFSFSRPAGTY